jgi:hypothetical protein
VAEHDLGGFSKQPALDPIRFEAQAIAIDAGSS